MIHTHNIHTHSETTKTHKLANRTKQPKSKNNLPTYNQTPDHISTTTHQTPDHTSRHRHPSNTQSNQKSMQLNEVN